MRAEKLLFILVLAVGGCCSEETSKETVLRRQQLQEQVLETFKTACLRLQITSNWMSVLFKILAAWTSTTARNIKASANLTTNSYISDSVRILFPERPPINNSHCSSLRSLHVTLQTFIQFQAQLLELKKVLASLILKTGIAKFDAVTALIKDRIKGLDLMNGTLTEMFSKLKESSKLFSFQEPDSPSTATMLEDDLGRKIISPSREDAVQTVPLQETDRTENLIMEPSNNELKQERSGNFFQNLGRTLEGIFV